MDFVVLKTNLKTKVEPVYLLYGTDIFLLYKSIELIKAVMPNAEVTNFEENSPVEEVISALRTPSFFSSKRVVIYRLAEKTSSAILNEYIKKTEPDSVLILMGTAEKNIYNIKNACEVNCNVMPADILVKLIANQVAPKSITRAGAEFLAEATGGNYGVINNELNKIVSYYTDVNVLDLPQLTPFVTKTTDYQIYELGSAILLGKSADAEKILLHLFSTDIAEYLVFGGLVSQFRRAFYSVATTADESVVSKILGCSPYAIKYARRDFRTKIQSVKEIYRDILDLEYKIKSGQVSIPTALFSLICR